MGTPLDQSIGLLQNRRQEMAAWLALKVLQTDPAAMQDDALQESLIRFQDALTEQMRKRLEPGGM